MRNEPRKLRHISLNATASQKMKISEERRRRENEIRPLGGVIKVGFRVLPSQRWIPLLRYYERGYGADTITLATLKETYILPNR